MPLTHEGEKRTVSLERVARIIKRSSPLTDKFLNSNTIFALDDPHAFSIGITLGTLGVIKKNKFKFNKNVICSTDLKLLLELVELVPLKNLYLGLEAPTDHELLSSPGMRNISICLNSGDIDEILRAGNLIGTYHCRMLNISDSLSRKRFMFIKKFKPVSVYLFGSPSKNTQILFDYFVDKCSHMVLDFNANPVVDESHSWKVYKCIRIIEGYEPEAQNDDSKIYRNMLTGQIVSMNYLLEFVSPVNAR